jgi:putative two-component system response regulator
MQSLAPVLPIIRSHHERWDGSGYPDGLGGEEIPLLARILQVADIYDALTTARPYKPAFSHQHAIEIMIEEARRGWRDPELVPLFAEVSQHQVSQHGDKAGALWPGNTSMQQSLDNMRRELSK